MTAGYLSLFIALSLLVLVPWLWRYRIKPYQENRRLEQKLQNDPNYEKYKITNTVLAATFSHINGGAISKRERNRLRMEEDNFIYGEIEFLSFITILNRVTPQPGEIFFDLGCGTGKAVFTAALSFDFARVIGVELIPGLCAGAKHQINKAKSMIELHGGKFTELFLQRLASVEIIHEDFHECDIGSGDIIFINATCLSYHTWEKLLDKLHHLKIGSRVIVTTKQIPPTHFKLIYQNLELMSWGMNSLYIYQKIS